MTHEKPSVVRKPVSITRVKENKSIKLADGIVWTGNVG